MKTMQILPALLIVIAVAVETVISSMHDMKLFNKRDSLANVTIGCTSVFVALLMKGFGYAILERIHQLAFFNLPGNVATSVLLFLLCDLQYYWFHRLGHVSRFFWASHAIHHSSEKYNYTVGMRLAFTNTWYRFLILSPACLFGFAPAAALFTDSLINYYSFFLHTESVGKLGWLEKILNTPSNHRVHHSSNPQYIDKNFGGSLIIWDKLFGTFIEEEEKPRYGLTKSFIGYNPITIVLDEWKEMIGELKAVGSFRNVIKVIFGYPGRKPQKKTASIFELKKNHLNTSLILASAIRTKKQARLRTAYVISILMGTLLLFSSFTTYDSENWESKKNENGISVFTRSVTDSPLKQVRVVTKVNSSLSGIVALLLDVKNYPQWMEGCREANTWKVLSDHEVYNYQVTDLPWPISDRDVVTHFQIEQDAGGVVRFIKTAEPKLLPENPSAIRIQHLYCIYTLTPVSSDSVIIDMQLEVDPNGSIPAWLINANVVAAPYKSTEKMIQRLPSYQSASFSFIKEWF